MEVSCERPHVAEGVFRFIFLDPVSADAQQGGLDGY